MPVALTTDQMFDYKLVAEKDSPSATIFTIRGLSSVEFARIRDVVNKHGEHEGVLEMVRLGLMEVKNFVDANGAPIRLVKSGGKVQDSFLARLTWTDINEIGMKIIEATVPSTEDLGKSQSQS